ncbi:MAG: hypothetical protein ACLFWD_04955 [Anaerolineales bacterium]
MEKISILSTLAGLLLRLGLPAALTLLAAYGLSVLDKRWQQQANKHQPSPVRVIKCWVLKDCSPQQREACAAYQQREMPCWQIFRDDAGRLPERCLGCDVFRDAPVIEPA